MDERLAEYIAENIEDAEVREDYSGRGMYGHTTFGVVINDTTELVELFFNFSDEISCLKAENELPLFTDNLNIDGMGRQIIIY